MRLYDYALITYKQLQNAIYRLGQHKVEHFIFIRYIVNIVYICKANVTR